MTKREGRLSLAVGEGLSNGGREKDYRWGGLDSAGGFTKREGFFAEGGKEKNRRKRKEANILFQQTVVLARGRGRYVPT